jgi:hypothetical protein
LTRKLIYSMSVSLDGFIAVGIPYPLPKSNSKPAQETTPRRPLVS